jgi:hypothetical protein
VHTMHLHCLEAKLPNLKLKTLSMQLLGSLLLDIALPGDEASTDAVASGFDAIYANVNEP